MAYGLAALALATPVSKTLTDIALVATGFLFLADWRAGRARPLGTPLDGAILAWGASQALSALVSVDPVESVRELRNLGYWALFYLAAWGVAAGARRALLVTLWLGAGAVAAAQGLAEFAVGFDLLHEAGPNASGFFIGHLPFGHFQAMLFALALALLRESNTRKEQVVLVALVVVFASAVVASGGRGPWLALAVTALVVAFREAPRRIVAALAIVFAIQIAVVARQPGGLESFYRSYVVVDDAEIGEVPDATVYSNLWRLTMWREGLRLFSLRPVLGTGVESTGALSREFRTPFVDFGVAHLHSNYLELTMTRGFVGLAALFGLGLAFVSVWRTAIAELPRGSARAVVIAALGAVVLHAVHGLTYYSLGSTPIQMGFYFVSGLAMGVVLRELHFLPSSPVRIDALGVACAFLALTAAIVASPLLVVASGGTLVAAGIALAVSAWRAVRGVVTLLEASLVLAFLTISGAALVLLGPLPNGLGAVSTVAVSAAAPFVVSWISLRIVGAARGGLVKHAA